VAELRPHAKKFLEDNRSGGQVSVGKGGGLIICHAGSDVTGSIPESKLIFLSKSKCITGLHGEMNDKLF
jgi:hypothetical protein